MASVRKYLIVRIRSAFPQLRGQRPVFIVPHSKSAYGMAIDDNMDWRCIHMHRELGTHACLHYLCRCHRLHSVCKVLPSLLDASASGSALIQPIVLSIID